MSQFYDEFSNDAEREQKQCVYQYWKEFETGKPLSYRERKKEEYELSQGRLITVAYKGVMMHIDFETNLEKEYQLIINKQNKMKTSKIKSIQNDGTWKDLFKFEVQMENGDVGGCFAKTQIPSWKVGDEKSYEYEQKGKFWNIKFLADAKPAWTGGSSAPKSYGKSPEDKADIARAVALKAAVDLRNSDDPFQIIQVAMQFEHYLTTGRNLNGDAQHDAIANRHDSNADDLPF